MRFFVLRDGQYMAQIFQCCHHHNSNPWTFGRKFTQIQREFKVVSSSSRVSSLASCLAARKTENPLCLPHRQNNCRKDISTIKDLQDTEMKLLHLLLFICLNE